MLALGLLLSLNPALTLLNNLCFKISLNHSSKTLFPETLADMSNRNVLAAKHNSRTPGAQKSFTPSPSLYKSLQIREKG